MQTINPGGILSTSNPRRARQAHELLQLDRDTVQALLTPDDALQAVRQAFEHHGRGNGRLFPLVREAVGDEAVFGIKSGDIAQHGLMGLKVAGFWPARRNGRRKHP